MISLHNTPEQTGNAPYVASLAAGLARGGWAVRVIAAHPHYPQWRIRDGYGQWRRADTESGVRVERLRHYVPRHPSNFRRLLAETSFGLRAFGARWGRPDAVVLVSPAMVSSSIALLRARLTDRDLPVLTWVQDLYGQGMTQTDTGGSAAREVVTRMERALLRGSDRVVVIHDRFRDVASGMYGLDPADVGVVRNWSHLTSAAAADRSAIRTTHGWRDDEVVVLHGGNQGVKQGLENVVAAARLADARAVDVRFVLVGHGSQNALLREAATGIERIQFLPPLSDEEYADALSAADVLLVNELAGVTDMAVPSKLTSYFRSGRPVIAATDAGSITAEEVQRAGAGLRVDADAPGHLLDGVLALSADEDACTRHGDSARDFADEHLQTAAAVRSFAAQIESAVAARSDARLRRRNHGREGR